MIVPPSYVIGTAYGSIYTKEDSSPLEVLYPPTANPPLRDLESLLADSSAKKLILAPWGITCRNEADSLALEVLYPPTAKPPFTPFASETSSGNRMRTPSLYTENTGIPSLFLTWKIGMVSIWSTALTTSMTPSGVTVPTPTFPDE